MSEKTVLVIDDEVDLQQLVRIALKSRGYVVETANNGVEGLEKLKTIKPHLIILDMNMPQMGGLEFYQRICVDDKPSHPVLVLTARANMEQLFREFNIDGFMAKPFEVDELLDTVDTIVEKRFGSCKKVSVSLDGKTPKICIAENDPEALNAIGATFLSAGYMVNPAQTGTEAIERISSVVPEIALIKLGLFDISGDIVIMKLKQMAKTEDVKCILYTSAVGETQAIAQHIAERKSIARFVAYREPADLLRAVNEVFRV